jgi:hypothetical protein
MIYNRRDEKRTYLIQFKFTCIFSSSISNSFEILILIFYSALLALLYFYFFNLLYFC